MTIRSVAVVWALIGGCACSRPASGPPSAAAISAELVEAGCLPASATDPATVAAGLASDAQPGWFSCLAAGGTIVGCAVPCAQ